MKNRNRRIKTGRIQAEIKESGLDEMFMERRIITGMIISTDYLSQIRNIWKPELIAGRAAQMLSTWCFEFYDKYNHAPGQEIESIFVKRTKTFNDDFKEDITEILKSLSDEYTRASKFNVQYLVDQTYEYFQEQNIDSLIGDIKNHLNKGDILPARDLILNFRDIVGTKGNELDLSSPDVLKAIERAFDYKVQNVIEYPYQMGDFWNDQLVRGGFVALMGPEKRGKTFMLLDMARRAAEQHSNVAFFQAGDMTEAQQLRRIAINLTKRSDRKQYIKTMWEPVRDCIHNQLDTCTLKERECGFGPFEGEPRTTLNDMTLDRLVKAHKENKGYKPCHNCVKYWKNKWGAVWVKRVRPNGVLTTKDAKDAVKKYFIKHKRRFKLASYPSGTLTVSEIKAVLHGWERSEVGHNSYPVGCRQLQTRYTGTQ